MTRGLGKVSQVVRAARAAALETYGLHPGQDVIVWLLGAHPEGLAVREIADTLGVDGPSVTRSLARLDDKGWFTRERVPGDRRQVRIVPTSRAVEAVQPLEASWAAIAETACAGMDDQARAEFLQRLEDITARLTATGSPETTSPNSAAHGA